MKKSNFFGLLIALCAINTACAVDLLQGAPVTSVRGTNYNNFSKQYRGYIIDVYGEVDRQWLAGAIAALKQDGLYNTSTFANVLWGDIEPLVNYYAQGNQAAKNNLRNAFEYGFNNVMYGSVIAPTTQTMAPVPPQQPVIKRELPAPVKLTFISILGGALGEPYKLKTMKVYNSGVQVYVDALVKDINRDLNAYYPPEKESIRIENIKRSIDKNHNFLEQYLKGRSVVTPAPVSMPALPAGTGPTLPAGKLSLQSILGGALGEPYTSKANEVFNSGVEMYVKDLERKINLYISGTAFTDQARAQGIKESIDTVHGWLEQYRKKNVTPTLPAGVTPALPAGQLSLQSILGGALGEPYTSKANEVYNSGVQILVDTLARQINIELRTSYEDESLRIKRIKTYIEQNYNNLQLHRKKPIYVTALSERSILAGALGEPYTSKANEVFNSGVVMYEKNLADSINLYLGGTAFKTDQERAQRIKESIDTVHGRLSKYLAGQ